MVTSRSSRRCDPGRPATGASARSATPRCCARRSCSVRRARAARARAEQRRRAVDRERTGCATRDRRHRATGQDVSTAQQDPPRRRRRRCATSTRSGRSARASFLRDTELVTLPPGEKCAVEPSPPFQRPVLAVASYQRPPRVPRHAARPLLRPYPPDGTSQEEIQKRLEGELQRGHPDDGGARGVSGPPLAPRHGASPIRRTLRHIFGTPYFSEGWALYAERVMREQGFFTDPKQQLYQYEATIFRAARIVVDTSLHMGEMTFDEAVTFMVEEDRAHRAERARRGRPLLRWPTQASSYLTGCWRSSASATRSSRPAASRITGAARVPRRDHVAGGCRSRWPSGR